MIYEQLTLTRAMVQAKKPSIPLNMGHKRCCKCKQQKTTAGSAFIRNKFNAQKMICADCREKQNG